MIKLTSKRYSDNLKSIIKHAVKKTLRRTDRREILAQVTDTLKPTAPRLTTYVPYNAPKRVIAVLVWDNGLDYNLDGTAYQDDAPGDYPHSYHLTRKDAEVMAAYLENGGCEANRITIVEGFHVPEWDENRIPQS